MVFEDRRKQLSRTPNVIQGVTVPVWNVVGLSIEVIQTQSDVIEFGIAALFRNQQIMRFRNDGPRAKFVLFTMSFDNLNPPTHVISRNQVSDRTTAVTGPPPKDNDFKTRATFGSGSPICLGGRH